MPAILGLFIWIIIALISGGLLKTHNFLQSHSNNVVNDVATGCAMEYRARGLTYRDLQQFIDYNVEKYGEDGAREYVKAEVIRRIGQLSPEAARKYDYAGKPILQMQEECSRIVGKLTAVNAGRLPYCRRYDERLPRGIDWVFGYELYEMPGPLEYYSKTYQTYLEDDKWSEIRISEKKKQHCSFP